MGSIKVEDWQYKFLSNPESTWSEFLDQYNTQILGILSRMLSNSDQKMDAYSYILEKIKSQKFHRIINYYKIPRVYDFTVWISVVVRNLCHDFIRDQKGRHRLPKYVQSLPNCDQTLYKFIFWKQYPVEITYEIIKMNYGYTGTFSDMMEKLADINNNIEGQHFSHLSADTGLDARNPLFFALDTIDNQATQIKSADTEIISQESRLIFDRIFENLDTQDQLILKLHFLYGKKLKDIANLLKIKNIWKVHRRLKKALGFLYTELNKANISIEDIEIKINDTDPK